LGSRDEFGRLLPITAIAGNFALPSKEFLLYRVVYEQTFGSWSGKDSYSDKIGFWYKTSSTEVTIQDYVERHHLSFGPFPHHDAGQIWVDEI
jgi:hypothetical protein